MSFKIEANFDIEGQGKYRWSAEYEYERRSDISRKVDCNPQMPQHVELYFLIRIVNLLLIFGSGDISIVSAKLPNYRFVDVIQTMAKMHIR